VNWPRLSCCWRNSASSRHRRAEPTGVRETTDPEVVVTEITDHGWSHVTGAPYRFTALGVIRVRDGEIVC
jgi:hypothetical protein